MNGSYNTKVEGHRGEAVRLEQMARDLLSSAAIRKEIAAELRTRAKAHWEAAEVARIAAVEAEVYDFVS